MELHKYMSSCIGFCKPQIQTLFKKNKCKEQENNNALEAVKVTHLLDESTGEPWG